MMGLVVTTILIALYYPIFSLSAGGTAGGGQ
jgi:type II secretory pathway component PulF